MSEDFNKTFERRVPNKRTFLWIGLEETSNEESVNTVPKSEAKPQHKCGLTFVPLDDNTDLEFSDENIENQTKKLKKTEQTFNWVPFGENFANTTQEYNNFVVPQTLPKKLKNKLTPLKITPARRSSGGSSSSLRRATFRVKPSARHHLNLLSMTTTKKRRSSGSHSSAFKILSTPKSRSSLIEAQTPSSLIKSCLGVEDIQYISWINAMLASKSDEKSDKMDSNQLILDCFNSNKTSLTVCPSNEEMSVETYKESVKWNQLRSAANSLYRSEDVSKINRKIMNDIKSGKYCVRKDRAIHADTGIRKHIMDLLLSYNPLWLRIGLETVFQQKIVITSHLMRLSLGKFIAQNLLVSKELMSRYGHKTVSHFFKDEQHIIAAKKYILSKFLLLLNFLDRAKRVRLIEHNPCLFRKLSKHKSTMDLIIGFGREYITGVGDITKHLRKSGFSIDYKQTAIEEFDFEVNNLAVDLRCGIRLARLAEIITNNRDLLSKLLYPANNITRKLHNVDIAFKAFADIVPKGITPKDIVFGHRKKTFELLDSIIFKHKSDQILMEQKILEDSVVFIQRLFRKKLLIKVRLQKIIWIQSRFRANKLMKTEREYYLKLKSNVIKVQKIFRNKLIEIRRKRAAIKIQSLWRGFSTRKRIDKENENLLKTVVWIQRKFRANRLMKSEKEYYLKLKSNTIKVQKIFRRKLVEMRRERAAIKIQSSWRGFYTRKRIHEENRRIRKVIWIQRRIRANKLMKTQREYYLKLKSNTIKVQKIFRIKLIEMRRKRAAIKIQSSWRGFSTRKHIREEKERLQKIIWIQRRVRANKLMKTQREYYLNLKSNTIRVQKIFRRKLVEIRRKRAAIKIQALWRGFSTRKHIREENERLQKIIWIQRKIRANKLMKTQREYYLKLKSNTIRVQKIIRINLIAIRRRRAAIKIQSLWRGFSTRQRIRIENEKLQKTVIWIQRKIRANKLMKTQKEYYLKLKLNTIKIQKLFRIKLIEMRRKRAAIKIQSSWRGFSTRKHIREEKERLQKIIWIQRRVRANRIMKSEKEYYLKLKSNTIKIQILFRRNLIEKRRRSAAIKIQSLWRGFSTRNRIREENERLLKTVLWIQSKIRANKLMKTERDYYFKLKSNTIKIQTIFRNNLVEKRRRKAVTKIQSLWRGFSTRKRIREENERLQKIIWIQRRIRAKKLMKTQREYYLKLKSYTIRVQKIFRQNLIEIKRRKAVIKIQSSWRGFSTRKRIREENERLLKTVLWIQSAIRANKLMKTERDYYLKLKSNTIRVQQIFRIKLIEMRRRRAAIKIQSLWRGFITRKHIREENERLVRTVIWIQSKIRAKKLMKTKREYYLRLKSNTIIVQKIFRIKLIEMRRRRAAIKIQSLWRGFSTRKCIHEANQSVGIAFEKIKRSNSSATDEMRLGIITYNSLRNLLTYDSLLKLAHDLLSLDKTTRLSPESCQTIAKYGAVRILLQILNESNRSEPHKEIIVLTINILLNLAKYPKTLPNLVSNPETIDTLFKIIKNFSANALQIGRQNELISKLFTLLWILLKNETILEKIKCDKRKMAAIAQIFEHLKKEKDFIIVKRTKGVVKKDYNFVPIWQIARKNVHQFDNHLIAILAVVRRLNIDK